MIRVTDSTSGIHAVLLDIEGTTTPISFVHEVLFPFARVRLRKFLSENHTSAEVLTDIDRLREEHATDVAQGLNPPALVEGHHVASLESIVEYLNWLMDRDRKSPALKSLQGKIWREGYLDGSLRAELFADVKPALERWRQAGVMICIFSSGSRLAQELLFAHTDAGNVTRFINSYFDTSVGKKTEAASYRGIANELKLLPETILFISDVVAELDAARTAGMKTLLCVRPGNARQPSNTPHDRIETFERL
jgi:enolase-phosphatase E1